VLQCRSKLVKWRLGVKQISGCNNRIFNVPWVSLQAEFAIVVIGELRVNNFQTPVDPLSRLELVIHRHLIAKLPLLRVTVIK